MVNPLVVDVTQYCGPAFVVLSAGRSVGVTTTTGVVPYAFANVYDAVFSVTDVLTPTLNARFPAISVSLAALMCVAVPEDDAVRFKSLPLANVVVFESVVFPLITTGLPCSVSPLLEDVDCSIG